MKIATFNINNINRRLPNLLVWLRQANPDIVCLQELKAEDSNFPERELSAAGYHAAWHGQRTWNGVAILSKIGPPVVTRRSLPGDPSDRQSRYIEAAIGGILIGCAYAPNGNPQPGPKFDYKLKWLDRLIRHGKKLLAEEFPIVLAGDFNVVPTNLDIYPTKSWDKDALLQPKARAAFRKLIAQGWIDSLRTLHPDDPTLFTFWHYMRNRWARDAGLRIDHLLLSPNLKSMLSASGVDKLVRGEVGASDHAPVWITLAKARVNTKSRPIPASRQQKRHKDHVR